MSPENLAAGLKFSWPTYKSGLRVMIHAHLQTGSTWAFSEIFRWEVGALLRCQLLPPQGSACLRVVVGDSICTPAGLTVGSYPVGNVALVSVNDSTCEPPHPTPNHADRNACFEASGRCNASSTSSVITCCRALCDVLVWLVLGAFEYRIGWLTAVHLSRFWLPSGDGCNVCAAAFLLSAGLAYTGCHCYCCGFADRRPGEIQQQRSCTPDRGPWPWTQ